VNGETEQEKAERLAYEKGRREQAVTSHLEAHDREIGDISKQVQLNTGSILDLNTNIVRQVSEVRHDIEDQRRAFDHEFKDDDGAVVRLSRQVSELTGSPIASSREWHKQLWLLGIGIVATAVATGLVYLAVGLGHT
jgi:hypothetical protein